MVDEVFEGRSYKGLHLALGDEAKDLFNRGMRYYIGEGYKYIDDYAQVIEWLKDNGKKGLLLTGNNGVGKSVIACALIPTLMFHYLTESPHVYPAYRLSDIYRNQTTMWDLIDNRPIVIDDLGTEHYYFEYGEKRDLFAELVDQAEKDKRLMIITTNLTTDQIKERYGMRTYDRLRALTKVVCLTGESMRN